MLDENMLGLTKKKINTCLIEIPPTSAVLPKRPNLFGRPHRKHRKWTYPKSLLHSPKLITI